MLEDAKRTQSIAEKQLKALQSVADQSHISVLAMDAPSDLVSHSENQRLELEKKSMELDIKDKELMTTKAAMLLRERELAVANLDIQGMKLTLNELQQTKQSQLKQIQLLTNKLQITNDMLEKNKKIISQFPGSQPVDPHEGEGGGRQEDPHHRGHHGGDSELIQQLQDAKAEMEESLNEADSEVEALREVVSKQTATILAMEKDTRELTEILEQSELLNQKLESDIEAMIKSS
jgi:hypothetical protein